MLGGEPGLYFSFFLSKTLQMLGKEVGVKSHSWVGLGSYDGEPLRGALSPKHCGREAKTGPVGPL